jgi:Rrf2 family protein
MFYICSMFNKETEYALRGLVYIQTQNMAGRKPGIAEITRQIDAPTFYTAKILQRMVRNGFLQSQKGKGGGFYFNAAQAALPIKEVVRAIEGEKTFLGCSFGMKDCSDKNPCPMHDQYAPIREAFHRMLATETIASLASRSGHFFELTDPAVI